MNSVYTSLVNIVRGFTRFIYGSSERRTIFAPDYLHLLYLKRFVGKSLSSFKEGNNILDIGSGDQRYKPLIPDGIDYIAMDYKETKTMYYKDKPNPDMYGSVESIPLASDSIKYVLCTEVLEHVKDVSGALSEIYRVLEPGGRAVITVPFIFPEHNQPYDFRRLSVNGLAHESSKAGFNIYDKEKLGSIGSVMVSISVRWIHSLVKESLIGKALLYVPGLIVFPLLHCILNIMGYFIDNLPSPYNYIGVGLVCEKK